MAGQLGGFAEGVSISPNPLANGFATLRYSLPHAGPVRLSVFDVTGRAVLTRILSAGRVGSATVDLRSLSGGVYLVAIAADGLTATQKMVVQR
jgi:hypothetical protein